MSLSKITRRTALALSASIGLAGFAGAAPAAELLNVSYDPTRELYSEYNAAFAKHWKAKSGEDITIKQSHGGSGKQARAVIDGLDADVVTLALAGDVDQLYKNGGLIPADWAKRLPQNSAPYTSTIVFLVRKGNPKGIKEWSDLGKDGIEIVTPNPKTSGGARWNYLAAWGAALKTDGGSEEKAKDLVTSIYKNTRVLDSGARGSLTTFTERGIGDVLISWENEAYLATKELGPDKFDIVTPTISILAEPSVAVVDKNVDKKGTRKVAEEYLAYLYSPEGQDIAGKHYYRPRDAKAAEKYKAQFSPVKLFTIDEVFGGWSAATEVHFKDGGIFDQIFGKKS